MVFCERITIDLSNYESVAEEIYKYTCMTAGTWVKAAMIPEVNPV